MVDFSKNSAIGKEKNTKSDVYKAVPAKVDPLKELTFTEKLSQQKLPAYYPEVRYVPTMIITISISVIFIILGALISYEIERVLSIEKALTVNISNVNDGVYTLQVTQDIKGDVFFMYKLENFYQNHRLYYKAKQRFSNLYGITYCSKNQESIFTDTSIDDCGTGFNFMYQNEFVLKAKNSIAVPMTDKNIVLDVDQHNRRNVDHLKNEPNINVWKKYFDNDTCLIVNSSCWDRKIYELDENPANNGFANKDLIVWQRLAAFSTFRKLYRRLVRSGVYERGLPKGNYTLEVKIKSKMPYHGLKQYFIITVPSWLGIRSKSFGVLYVVVGLLGILACILLTLFHLKFGEKAKSKVFPADKQLLNKST